MAGKEIQPQLEAERKNNSSLLAKEIDKSFSRLWKEWKQRIQKEYAWFALQDVKMLFAAMQKFTSKQYPQSILATVLIEHARNARQNNERLNPGLCETQLLDKVSEYAHIKKVYEEFSTKKWEKEFAWFKKYRESNQNKISKQWISVDQILETKWYSYDTYLFTQYLSKEFVRDPNRDIVWGSLSVETKKELTAYTDSNLRMKAVLQLPSIVEEQPVRTDDKQLQSQQDKQETLQAQALSGANKDVINTISWKQFDTIAIDANDIAQFKDSIVRAAYSKEDLQKLFQSSGIEWDLLGEIVAYIYTEKSFSQTEKTYIEGALKNILDSYLHQHAKPQITNEVVRYYCAQISSVMKVGGEYISIDTQAPMSIAPDWSVEYSYKSAHGLIGKISIDAAGNIQIESPLWYENDNDKNTAMQYKKMPIAWKVVPFWLMFSRVAQNKDAIFSLALKNMDSQWNDKANQDWSSLVVDTIWPDDESIRKDAEIKLGSELLSINSMDQLYWLVWQAKRINQNTQYNDKFSTYVENKEGFLDRKINTEYEWVFVLRETLFTAPQQKKEKLNIALSTLQKSYEQFSKQLSDYPFWSKKSSNKETVFDFMERFCVNGEFMMDACIKCVDIICAMKPLPTSIIDMIMDKKFSLPTGSLYDSKHPLEREEISGLHIEKEKSTSIVASNAGGALADLEADVLLS